MVFIRAFLHSIQLPQKKAMFQLNRIGMDITVVYMFILLAIVSIPSLIDILTKPTGSIAEMNIFFVLVYFFFVYYLSLTFIVFISLSILAFIGTGISKLLQRKIRFAILWKLCAFTTTLPLLLYTILAFFLPVSQVYLWLLCAYTFFFLIKMITVFPRRKKRPGK